MEAIIIILISIILLILIKYIFKINFKQIKNIEKDYKSEELDNITKKLPEDEIVCKEILKMLKNEDVTIEKNEEYNSCLYTVFNNKITLGKFSSDFIRIQTIAHECLHSVQSKRLLLANFIISNIYMIYFIILIILKIANVNIYVNITLPILIILSMLQYLVRAYLENDAMIKAKYLAKKYIESTKKCNDEEIEKLLEKYEEINKIGIPTTNFMLIAKNIIKIIIFCIFIVL